MGIGTTELLIIFGIILLVFGAGKIPKVARDLGSGIKEFKRSLSSDVTEDTPTEKTSQKPTSDNKDKPA